MGTALPEIGLGFLLIDARNTSNKENWMEMIWAVWDEWISCAQFTFSFYRHWDNIVVQDSEEGSGHFLNSK